MKHFLPTLFVLCGLIATACKEGTQSALKEDTYYWLFCCYQRSADS